MKLTTKQRKNLSAKDFVYPKKRKYPIEDRTHAINALARVKQFGSKAEQIKVRMAVLKRYPDLKGRK